MPIGSRNFVGASSKPGRRWLHPGAYEKDLDAILREVDQQLIRELVGSRYIASADPPRAGKAMQPGSAAQASRYAGRRAAARPERGRTRPCGHDDNQVQDGDADPQ